ncbi:helix-turn-helix transcriptional regulator [Streptosporangium canum]|uniref:helix-turn-helix transcriptional regulator n=1 Tax=Streptosporangium canum TaxID=324952 RepID=UPI0034446A67
MTPTIRLRNGADERLKETLGLATDTALANHIGVDQGQYNRIKNGRSAPGPYFQARLLIAVEALNLDFYDLFEVVPDPQDA